MTGACTPGTRRRVPLAGRVAGLARHLLASGFLPVFPQRPELYRPGPLTRAETGLPSPGSLTGGKVERLRMHVARLGAPLVTGVSLGALATVLALSRMRGWTRSGPAQSFIRQARMRHAPHLGPAVRHVRQTPRGLPALLLHPLRPADETIPGPARGPRRADAPAGTRTAGSASRTRPARSKPLRILSAALAKSGRGHAALEQATRIAGAGSIALALGIAVSYLPSFLGAGSSDQAPDRTGSIPVSGLRPTLAAPEHPSRSGEQVSAKLQGPALSAVQAGRALEPYRIAWPFDIADGLTFGPEGATKTRLAGLEGPPRDAVCNDRNGQPWACGLQARAALNNATRRQTLACEPVTAPVGGILTARCGGDIDLARELVLAGFARPAGPDSALDVALDDARRNERGLWNGGWTIRTSVR